MKIFAIENNYIQHGQAAEELLFKPSKPVVFLKPDSSLLKDNKPFFPPDDLGRISFGAELVIRICRLGKSIPKRFAYRYYDAMTVGIDFTAKELLDKLKAKRLPWDLSKGFDGAAAIGKWINKEYFHDIQAIHFHMDVNNETIQETYSGDMNYKVDELISYISRYYTLKTGDLLYTGTPIDTNLVQINDHIDGYIEDQKVLEFNIK